MIKRIGLFFLAAVIIAFILINLLEKPFDAKAWKTEPLQRYEMVDDIIESQILSGKSKREIIEILGQPNSKSNAEKEGFIYNIGDPPSFFSSQKEYLLIIFKNEHVEKGTLAVE